MSQNLDTVNPIVRLDGEEIGFESLILEQSMNTCHRFDVVKEFMTQDEMWKESPEKLLDYIGKRVLIRFEHQFSGFKYEFNGWVTDVRIDAWESQPDYGYYNHKSNRVHILGSGDIIKLDSSRGNDSFTDSQLKNIVAQSASSGDVPVQCDPKFDGVIPFMMRYHETVFEFLNRLSSTFNEMCFYDGRILHFGQPDKSPVTSLVIEQDVFSFRTHASALPRKVEAYDYQYENDTTDYMSGGGKTASALLGEVVKRADRLYDDSELTVSAAHLTDSGYLMKYVEAKQSSKEGAMLTVEGETRTCRISLGSIVDISFPSKMDLNSLGRYRIVSIVHRVDKAGNYSNHFEATPEGREFVSQKFLGSVQAFPQMATVVDNSDSMGRVMVQFSWQGKLGKTTNWIPVQSPDAGGSGMKNRGLVFIPEIGDQVMVGFEYGDPSRPYVMGSLFTGKTGNGGGNDNNIHSIITKSGHQIVFNDDQNDWGITISDNNGNVIILNTKDKSISLTAGETISLSANNIIIGAAQNVSLYGGENVTMNANSSMTLYANEDIDINTGENISMSAKNIESTASELEQRNSDKLTVVADSEITMNSKKIGVDSTKENLQLASGKDVDVQAKGKVNLF